MKSLAAALRYRSVFAAHAPHLQGHLAVGLTLALVTLPQAVAFSVTLAGVPLGEVQLVSLAQPIDLTWAVGDAHDLVLVDVISDDGRGITCAFRDDLGAGSVPVATIGRGAGRIRCCRRTM